MQHCTLLASIWHPTAPADEANDVPCRCAQSAVSRHQPYWLAYEHGVSGAGDGVVGGGGDGGGGTPPMMQQRTLFGSVWQPSAPIAELYDVPPCCEHFVVSRHVPL